MYWGLTRIGNADSDLAALKRCAALCKALLQSIESFEFDVTKSLWLAVDLVFNYPHIRDFAACKKVFNVPYCDIKRKIAEVGGIRWRAGQGQWFSGRKSVWQEDFSFTFLRIR